MINHARTLLGNLAPTFVDGQFYDEQFVPESFVPITLSTSLKKLREFLFGTRPDRSFVNARLREYLSIVNNSLYQDYLWNFDSRIVALDEQGENAWIADEGILVSTTAPSDSLIQMVSSKKITEADYTGWMDFTYELTIVGENTIEVVRNTPVQLELSREIAYRNGVSEWFQIDSSGLQVKLLTQELGTNWKLSYRRRPQLSPGEITFAIANGIGAENFNSIFGLSNRIEPYKTFFNLFEDAETVRKVIGIVLAYIYRAEELRVQNG